jgi:hypothetical protein
MAQYENGIDSGNPDAPKYFIGQQIPVTSEGEGERYGIITKIEKVDTVRNHKFRYHYNIYQCVIVGEGTTYS